jgi:hypothetical protein
MNPEYGKLMCMICIEKNKPQLAGDISGILKQETYDRYEMEEHLETKHTVKEVITTLRENHWTMMK